MSITDPNKTYAWSPSLDTFDQVTIYDCDGLFCEVHKQSSLPLELSKPILDMAGMYAPLVVVTEIPGHYNNDEEIYQLLFYQHLELCDLGAMLRKLNELESGWRIEGFAVLSPRISKLSSEDIKRIAAECRLPSGLPGEPKPQPASQLPKFRVPWREVAIGLVGFALGVASSLIFP